VAAVSYYPSYKLRIVRKCNSVHFLRKRERIKNNRTEISGSLSGEFEDDSLLEYDAV
jgi:hypothetical protein